MCLKPLSQGVPFVLDPFQREALRCIENSQSVLVSAHTSAGKTVVAEYAIATSLRDTQRVIYTTPIKVNKIGAGAVAAWVVSLHL